MLISMMHLFAINNLQKNSSFFSKPNAFCLPTVGDLPFLTWPILSRVYYLFKFNSVNKFLKRKQISCLNPDSPHSLPPLSNIYLTPPFSFFFLYLLFTTGSIVDVHSITGFNHWSLSPKIFYYKARSTYKTVELFLKFPLQWI
jgi:hypothetical protein